MSGPPGSQPVEAKKKQRGAPSAKRSSGRAPTEEATPEERRRVVAQLATPFPPFVDDAAGEPILLIRTFASLGVGARPFRLRGVTNPAQFCYVAATMQALVHCPPLAHLCFLASALGKEDRAVVKTAAGLGAWMANYWKPAPTPLPAPRLDVLEAVRLEKRSVDGQHQQDTHELLVALLSRMDEEFAALGRPFDMAGKSPAHSVRSPGTDDGRAGSCGDGEDDDGRGWTLVGRGRQKLNVRHHKNITPSSTSSIGSLPSTPPPAETDPAATPIQRWILNGTLHSYFSGGKGVRKGYTNVVVEPFGVLPVAISSKPRMRLEEALESLSAKEVVAAPTDGDNDMKKVTYIGECPEILILQLQRYMWTREGECVKIDNVVEFGLDLTLPEAVLSPAALQSTTGGELKKRRRYRLLSVISHRGTVPNTGHYVCYLPQATKSGPAGETVFDLANDAKLSAATMAQVVADTPYILVYQRC